jgi:vancomycin resistance protein VanJ
MQQTATMPTSHTTTILRPLLRVRNAIPYLIDTYGVLVILLLLARQVLGERLEAIAAANMVLHYIVGVCIAFALLRLAWKRRLLTLLNAAPALLLVAYYVPDFLPKTAPPPITDSLSILSYNVRGGEMERIISIVDDANADVVFLQDAAMSHTLAAGDELRDEYPYQQFTMRDSRGFFMMSRYLFIGQSRPNPRLGFVRHVIEFNGQPLALYNIHLQSPVGRRSFDSSRRTEQVARILALMTDETLPHVLMGDFNLTEWSPLYDTITQHYTDAHRAQGWGIGLTRDIGEIPIARIDHAFTSPALNVLESKTWAYSSGSDHRPIFLRVG